MIMTTTTTTRRPAAKAAARRGQGEARTAKAPAPRGRKKTHTRPALPLAARQAEKVTETMYRSLTAPGAPKASPQGYIMGASMVLKLLLDQAVQQGGDRDALKAQVLTYIAAL